MLFDIKWLLCGQRKIIAILVHFPDFPEQTYRTHGDSYEEAARNGEVVLQLLLEEDGLSLPKPSSVTA